MEGLYDHEGFQEFQHVRRNHGPGGGLSGGGFHGPGGGSNSNSQNFQGGFNQQSGQGNQQQQQQGGYETNPKQLNGGQYHVFTTSLCKRYQKLHKRTVNAVEPAVPR
jgi:hypothetical protein